MLIQRCSQWRLCFLISVILAVSTVSIGYAQTPTAQSGIDASSGLSYFQLSDPNWTFASIALRPDGQELAVSTDSGQIEIYNGVLQHLHTLTGHTDVIWAMDWNSDGTKIASGGEDKTIHIWDANTFSTLLTIPQTSAVIAVAWCPDGSKLASIESEIVSTDSEGGIYTDDTLHVWDMTAGGTQIFATNFYNTASSVSWSPDGHQIVVGGGLTSDDNAILILDASTGSLVKRFPRAWSSIQRVSWSPDGTQLAYADSGDQAAVYLIDVATGTQTYLSTLQTFDSMTAVAWSPSGRILATGTLASNSVDLLDVPTQTVISLDGHPDYIRTLAWSADGAYLASQSADGTVRLWDMGGLPNLSSIPTMTPLARHFPEPTVTPTPKP